MVLGVRIVCHVPSAASDRMYLDFSYGYINGFVFGCRSIRERYQTTVRYRSFALLAPPDDPQDIKVRARRPIIIIDIYFHDFIKNLLVRLTV